MSLRRRCEAMAQTLDYGTLLPLLARMPVGLGDRVAAARGVAHAIFDYDWRSAALGQRYVRERTHAAMKALVPEGDDVLWRKLTRGRFVHNSREEWEAWLFPRDGAMTQISSRSYVEGIEEILGLNKGGKGVVLVSAHFGSFCLGMALLGMHGVKTNLVGSAVVENPAIHPAVREHFQRKYRSLEGRMGGRFVYHEEDFQYFSRALENGEAVVLLIDIPGSRSTVELPFLGKALRVPLGPWRLARDTGSPIAAYVCYRESAGTYRVVCTPPREVGDDPAEALAPCYAFLESWIRKQPHRWLASDLMAGYGGLAE